jgi:hypothetical protein
MIIHLPTLLRWTRGGLYLIAVTFTVWKISMFVSPLILPIDPYRLPVGDALSVHAKPSWSEKNREFSGWTQDLLGGFLDRLKIFYLTGE